MRRLILSLLTGFWGAAVMAALMSGMPGPLDPGLIGAAAAGAFVAAVLAAGLSLRPWPWILLTAPLVTTVGAARASLGLLLPSGHDPMWHALLVGPALVWGALASDPRALMVWLAGAVGLGAIGSHRAMAAQAH